MEREPYFVEFENGNYPGQPVVIDLYSIVAYWVMPANVDNLPVMRTFIRCADDGQYAVVQSPAEVRASLEMIGRTINHSYLKSEKTVERSSQRHIKFRRRAKPVPAKKRKARK